MARISFLLQLGASEAASMMKPLPAANHTIYASYIKYHADKYGQLEDFDPVSTKKEKMTKRVEGRKMSLSALMVKNVCQ